ncbi:MAG: 2-succinyl-5-enolpyruvyl-6-hydroxy-3-cyclohexene-1-carboxylate synthase, partial [Flavobacteriales bacterium]|nr:2-succinyl-5-enolpyruvyl-6-hydroxy-3-cyclohexene-1-carboxylate synthase [Flavobacteriales bacterium]
GIACHVVIDERSAGFIALGMADRSGTPVALICTSGSAVLNHAPAVAEAFYRRIPLLVLSADRPEEWVDQGEGQTIRQRGALSAHVRYEGQLPRSVQDDLA